jgi:hypothetical protein
MGQPCCQGVTKELVAPVRTVLEAWDSEGAVGENVVGRGAQELGGKEGMIRPALDYMSAPHDHRICTAKGHLLAD